MQTDRNWLSAIAICRIAEKTSLNVQKNNMDPDVVDYLEISMHVGDHSLFFEEKELGNHDDLTDVSSTKDETDSGSDELFIDFSKIYRGIREHFLETISRSKSDESDSFIPYTDSCSVDNSDHTEVSATKDETDFERDNLFIDFSKANHGISMNFQETISQSKSDESDSFIPYSDSESEDEENMELQKIKRRKGVRNEHKWKRNVRQNNRLHGKKYVSTKNVVIEGKSMKPPCHDKCRLKCNQRFTQEQRLKIYSKYWHIKSWDSKRKFVCSCIQTCPVRRRRVRDRTGSAKTKTYKYIFTINNKKEIVCKTFFLNTLSISNKFLQIALTKYNLACP